MVSSQHASLAAQQERLRQYDASPLCTPRSACSGAAAGPHPRLQLHNALLQTLALASGGCQLRLQVISLHGCAGGRRNPRQPHVPLNVRPTWVLSQGRAVKHAVKRAVEHVVKEKEGRCGGHFQQAAEAVVRHARPHMAPTWRCAAASWCCACVRSITALSSRSCSACCRAAASSAAAAASAVALSAAAAASAASSFAAAAVRSAAMTCWVEARSGHGMDSVLHWPAASGLRCRAGWARGQEQLGGPGPLAMCRLHPR